jgi:hypothetical protein
MRKVDSATIRSICDIVFVICAVTVFAAFFMPWAGDCSGFELARLTSGWQSGQYWALLAFIAVATVFFFFRFRYVQIVFVLLGLLNLGLLYFTRLKDIGLEFRYGFWLTVAAYVTAVLTAVAAVGLKDEDGD